MFFTGFADEAATGIDGQIEAIRNGAFYGMAERMGNALTLLNAYRTVVNVYHSHECEKNGIVGERCV